MAGTLEIPAEGSPNSSEDPKIKAAITAYNNSLGAGNKLEGKEIVSASVGNTQLAAEAKPFDWYTPTVIATEQTRENVAFGALTTADEIKEVVLPTNGLIQIGYAALLKSSVAGAGRAAIFIGANQLKAASIGAPAVQEAIAQGTAEFHALSSAPIGLTVESSVSTSFVTTGQSIASGLCSVFAAAGTYTISVQFKATSGNVTAKERKLWVGVLGV